MIKVLYDENSGEIKDFWAIDEIPTTPYIEIQETEHEVIAFYKHLYRVDLKTFKLRKATEEELMPSLVELKQQKIIEDNKAFNEARNGIKTINGVKINIDPTSSVNITGKILEIMVNRSQGLTPLSVEWFDDENKPHIYTEDEFIEIGKITSAYIQTIQAKHSNNAVNIPLCETIEELNAIDINYTE